MTAERADTKSVTELSRGLSPLQSVARSPAVSLLLSTFSSRLEARATPFRPPRQGSVSNDSRSGSF